MRLRVTRQLRDIEGNPPRLVFRQHLRLQRFGFAVSRVHVDELPVGVADDIAAGHRRAKAEGNGGRSHD
jgi:hypothetical protein